MRNVYIGLIISIIIVLTVSCKEIKVQTVIKEYGDHQSETEQKIELDLSRFKQYENLVAHIDSLVCDAYIPQIILQKDTIHKKINLFNICYDNFGCFLIKQRNTVEIYNNEVFKRDKKYTLDSLEVIMKKDYFNNGKLPSYCTDPAKFIIRISYDDNFEGLENILEHVTQVYDNLQPGVTLKIWLQKRIMLYPPPPKLLETE